MTKNLSLRTFSGCPTNRQRHAAPKLGCPMNERCGAASKLWRFASEKRVIAHLSASGILKARPLFLPESRPRSPRLKNAPAWPALSKENSRRERHPDSDPGAGEKRGSG